MKKNRAYKKGEAYKDCSLILIVCEGEKTEPNYFSIFEKANPRKCKVEIFKNINKEQANKSAPKWLLEKVKSYKENNQLGVGDYLFIVSDADRWEQKSLHNIDSFCKEFENHFLIISNPCFEIWLYYHLGNPKLVNASTSKEWKKALHNKTITGFEIEKNIVNIPKAVAMAKKDDKNQNHFLADKKHSKVYRIIEVIEKQIGASSFRQFIQNALKK